MNFEEEAKKVVVAGFDKNGMPDFLTPGVPAHNEIPGVFSTCRFWTVDDVPSMYDNLGETSKTVGGFTKPGGAWFGMCSFPANSAGKLHVGKSGNDDAIEVNADNPSMHRSDSIDFEYIISGKVDFRLPGDKVRTLEAGDILIVTGVEHAWENRYDEPCVYLAVCVGAKPENK